MEKEKERLLKLNVKSIEKKIKELESIPLYENGKGLPIGYRNYNIMQTVIMKLCFLFYN